MIYSFMILSTIENNSLSQRAEPALMKTTLGLASSTAAIGWSV